MSSSGGRELRLLSFGDPTGEVWGAALDLGVGAFVIQTPEGPTSAAGSSVFQLHAEGPVWRVRADSFDLSLTPLNPADGEDLPAGDELCQVEGSVQTNGTDRTVACLGTRTRDREADLSSVVSVRALSGWFSDRNGLSLRALRPAASPGHEHDLLQATLFDTEAWVPVAEPRLSTTFGPDDEPERATLELWVGDEEELYPRRAAAEASGASLSVEGDGLRMDVTPLACHSGGLDGVGVYLIAYI